MIDKIIAELRDVHRFRYVIYSFVQINLKLRYRRSFLGFAWTVLAPMLNYLVIGIVFSFLMRNSIPNYFVYYFSGAVFFSIVSGTMNRAPLFLISNEHYIKKIYVPKLVFILNGTLYEITNFFLSALSLVILGIFFGKLSFGTYSLLALVSLVLVSFFLIGLGCMISVAAVYFRDLIHIIPTLVQAGFFITPVIYDENMIPAKYHIFIQMNPIYYFLEIFRKPLVFHQIPPTSSYVICVLLSFITFFSGLLLIKQFDNKIVFKL